MAFFFFDVARARDDTARVLAAAANTQKKDVMLETALYPVVVAATRALARGTLRERPSSLTSP
jgi:hypothetical protein